MHEMGLDHTLNVQHPNIDSLQRLFGHLTRTGIIGGRLEDKLKSHFDDKKQILDKIKEISEGDSILEILLYHLGDLEWVIQDIQGRKDLAMQISRSYTNYDNLMKGSRNMLLNLELGDSSKEAVMEHLKKTLHHQNNYVLMLNNFFPEEQDEETRTLKTILIGHPRKLKNCYKDNINEFSTNMVSIFNVEKATQTLSHESITLLTNDFKWLMDAIKQTRSFNDQEEEGRKKLMTTKQLFANLLGDLYQDFKCLPNRRVDLSHLEVMDGHIKRIEDLRMDISKLEPKFNSSNIDISYTFEGRACSETLNICEILKKIKYECSKLNKSITKEEKEA